MSVPTIPYSRADWVVGARAMLCSARPGRSRIETIVDVGSRLVEFANGLRACASTGAMTNELTAYPSIEAWRAHNRREQLESRLRFVFDHEPARKALSLTQLEAAAKALGLEADP